MGPDDTTDLIFTVVDVEQAVLRLDAKGIKGEVGVIKVTFPRPGRKTEPFPLASRRQSLSPSWEPGGHADLGRQAVRLEPQRRSTARHHHDQL